MPEYTYLLETRLTAAQQNALAQVRDAAREAGMVVFLTGGAVRDLTTGSSVRDLDFSVQGDARSLESALVARGATLWGKHEPSRTLYLWFPGSVRVEVSSTRAETYPKPGRPEYAWTGIVDDLFRRDFTVNAMALSLNEGSYGLLLDPLNGVADTEARQLRLVSNYGFIEDPSRMLRAVRLGLRLSWVMEERTAARYQNAREAEVFNAIDAFRRGYEMEEIAAEDDALGTLKALEAEGWMQQVFPEWTSAHADIAALENLHRNRIQLLMQGIAPDLQAAHFEVLTAKMKPTARTALKGAMVRPGLRVQWEALPEAAKEFGRLLTGKDAATASASWKLFHGHAAEPVLWLAHSGKGAAEGKFKQLFTVWPEVAKKVPVALMAELRISPDLPVYPQLLHELFLEQMDDKLQTDEEMRTFLEKYSPPAPPPPVSLKRSRSRKADAKGKRRGTVPGDEDSVQPQEAGAEEAGDAEERVLSETNVSAKTEPAAPARDAKRGDDRRPAKAPVKLTTPAAGRVQAPAQGAHTAAVETVPAKPGAKAAVRSKPEPVPAKPAKAVSRPAKPAAKPAAKSASKPAKKAAPIPVKKGAAARTPAKSQKPATVSRIAAKAGKAAPVKPSAKAAKQPTRRPAVAAKKAAPAAKKPAKAVKKTAPPRAAKKAAVKKAAPQRKQAAPVKKASAKSAVKKAAKPGRRR